MNGKPSPSTQSGSGKGEAPATKSTKKPIPEPKENKLENPTSAKITGTSVQELRPGYTIRVYQKIKQADKERVQMFEGVILAKKGKDDITRTITVRKIASGGYGVEKIFPLASPLIEKIEVVHKPRKVRQSKLYYLRQSPRKIKELREQK